MLLVERIAKVFFNKIGCLFFLSFFLFATVSHAQDDPRYNRFQYHKFHWRAVYSKEFNIYFPADAADSLYRYIAKETPDAIAYIKKATIKELPKDINIILYPSTDQLYESNIGGYETTQFTLPTFVAKGTRIILAFNGSYADMKKQLYEALARSLWESHLQEGGLEDQAKGTTTKSKTSSKKVDIPFWFKEGAIRYFAHGWTVEAEDNLRNSFEQQNFHSWQQILSYEPRLAGHAFCYFLTQKYYPKAVAQTVFQLQKKKNLSRAIRLITKHTLDTLYSQCFNYYGARFSKDTNVQKIPDGISIPRKKGIIWNVLISPKKDFIAYVTMRDGKRTVYVYDVRNKINKKITSYQLPPWIDDHSIDQYPLLSWDKDDRQLYVTKPVKGRIAIKRYTTDGELQESTVLYGIDGLKSIQPLSDREFLLTAFRKGQTDIVSYNDNKEKYVPYTDDEYDDADPIITKNGKDPNILFISDRPKIYRERRIFLIGVGYKKDTLWQGVYTVQGNELKPIVIDSAQYIHWDKPVLIGDNEVLLTNTRSGTEKDVTLNYINGHMSQLGSHHPFQYLPQTDEVSFYTTDKDSIHIGQEPLNEWIRQNKQKREDTSSPWLIDHRRIAALQAKEDSLLRKGHDTTHYVLDDVFSVKNDKKDSKQAKDSTKVKRTSWDKSVPYILQLHSAYFTAQVNNDYFMDRYQPYLNNQGQFKFPEVGGMAKGGFTDLLENHHFAIAYRIPSATAGSMFFASYENTERNTDWGLSYYRDVSTLQPDPSRNWISPDGLPYPNNAKVKTHYYQLFLHKPVTYDCSLGFQEGIRQDKTVFLATDKYSLDFPPIQSLWSITTLSFKLNKLHTTIPNLYKGFKIEAFLDGFKGFDQQAPVVFGNTINARYDQPLYKYITVVAQLHIGYSGGDQKVLYNLGGEDNNVTPRVDTNVHFLQSAPYAFQTLITPFRGYYQNSMHGNKFTLCNADVYFPIFQTLIPIETPLPPINNLQLGIFSDGATAKETFSNTANSNWLMSYGLSARTTLAGYPLRLDVAWPGNFSKQPVWYFSLNLQ